MKCFCIITNQEKDKERKVTKTIQTYLQQNGKECYIPNCTEVWGGNQEGSYQIQDNTDCIIVLGGDGTLLQTAREISHKNIPLLGVNLGTLGYLAEVEIANIEEALQQLIKGDYQIEHRMMLNGQIKRGGSLLQQTNALNDIVITRGGSLQIINYNIYVNGQFLNGYSADGIIVSTPTGSTGYNLSAGGPIVEPNANLMVITPICPHTLNTRSIVLGEHDTVLVEVAENAHKEQHIEVNFDGSCMVKLQVKDTIQIVKSMQETSIVKLNQVSFLEVLRRKMSHS